MSDPNGTFAWYELMTTDTAAAGAFYSSVVGWSVLDVSGGGMTYFTFNLGPTGVAGLMTLPEDAGPVPAWIGYIHVDDVDAYSAKVAAAGGMICRGPVDVPGMLRFCVVTDPQGAPFVLFTPDPRMPSSPDRPAPGSPGTIGWHELASTDGAAAFNFYSSLFGWAKGEAHDMGPMGTYQIFDVNGIPNGGMMTTPPGAPGSFWNYYINVDSIKAAIARIEAAGGKVTMGPCQVPGDSWVVLGLDPQGASFALISVNA